MVEIVFRGGVTVVTPPFEGGDVGPIPTPGTNETWACIIYLVLLYNNIIKILDLRFQIEDFIYASFRHLNMKKN